MNEHRDSRVDELIDALRRDESPSDARLEAGLGRLQGAIASAPAGAAGVAGASKLVVGACIVASAIAVGWFALGGGGGGEPAATRPAASKSAQVVEREESSVVSTIPAEAIAVPDEARAAAVAPPAAADEVAVATDVAPDPPAARAREVGKKKPSDAGTASGDLEAELALLQAATAALTSGDPRRALAQIDTHRRRYPGSALVDERELLRARALCDAGDRKGARKAAEAVLKRNPDTHLAARLRSVCE